MKKRIISLLTITVLLLTLIPACFTVEAQTNIQIGDYIQMGTYYGEPILWRCVDIDENGPLILSDKIICIKAFDAAGTNTSGSHGRGYYDKGEQGHDRQQEGSNYWADSNMRCWLNSVSPAGHVAWACGNPPNQNQMFLGWNEYENEAGFLTNFPQNERSVMKTVVQKTLLNGYEYSQGSLNQINSNFHMFEDSINDVVQNYKTAFSMQVTDTIFLLDVKQVNEVYNNRSILGALYYIGEPTQQCVTNSEYKSSSLAAGRKWYYWLRSPTAYDTGYSVRLVESGGFVTGINASHGQFGVRPAFYLADNVFFSGGNGSENNPYRTPYNYSGLSNADNYIIEQVKKYTSDDEMYMMNHILSSDYSDDAKLFMLNELFRDYGLTDAKEGIKYLSETSPHRMNYRYLTTNEIYCAYNFGSWLVNTNQGRLAKGLLNSSGLIFNFEKNEYLDFITGSTTETPGVKKYKKMLMDFMSAKETEIEVLETANQAADFLEKLVKLNNIEVDYRMEELMDEILNSTSKRRIKRLQEEFATLLMERAGLSKNLSFKSETFADALGTAGNTLSFVANTAEDVLSIINMEEQIKLYEKYSYFLQSIYQNKDVAAEMRIAAKQLYDDIKTGYIDKVISILKNSVDFVDNLIDTASMQSSLNQANLIIDFGAFLINSFFIDVGDFVRQASYTQGYAELSALFCLKLKEDASNFKASETSENAWKFFEDYTLLWRLRYMGEEQFLEMSSIKSIMGKIKAFNYSTKESIVRDTLQQLNNRKFEFEEYEIPESLQYVSKSVMNCPVNVYVYTQNGELIAELIDGVESDVTNEYGRFAVVYRPYTDEYAKVICQSTNEKLIIKAEAVSDGLVNFETASVDDENTYTFDNVNITKGNIIKAEDTVTYTIFSDEEDLVGTQYELNEISTNAYVPVESVSLNNPENISLNMGDKYILNPVLLPANATNRMVSWISDDERVLTVSNGVITALREGTTTVSVCAVDGEDVVDTIQVSVAPANLTLTKDHVSVNASIGQLIVVGYNNNCAEKIELINGYESELSGYDDFEYVKAFLWYDMTSISPLCESKMIYIH